MDKIDVGRAVRAPFADPEWVKKALLGLLWMLLVVTSPAVQGAYVEYIQRVSQGREDLPEWDDYWAKWVKGFLLSVAGFIYFLPVIVLGMVFAVPVIVAGASDSDAAAGLASGGFCLFFLVAVVYALAVGVFFGAASVNYAMRGDFGALFRFGEIVSRVRDGTGYFAAWIWTIVVALCASALTGVISAVPLLGWLAAYGVFYLEYMIMGHLLGQWAARSYGVQPATPTGTPGPVPPVGTYATPMYPPPAPPAYTPPAPPAPPAYAPPAPPAPPRVPAVPAPAPESTPPSAPEPSPQPAPEAPGDPLPPQPPPSQP